MGEYKKEKERVKEMGKLLNGIENEDDIVDEMLAYLRDNFLDHDRVSKKHNYYIGTETIVGPEYVVYYVAEYIDLLERELEQYRRRRTYELKGKLGREK